jgi:hypothetical protein
MRPLFVVLVASLVAGCGGADGAEVDGKTLVVEAAPTAPLHLGVNTFTVAVRTLGGQPLSGARLDALATMPAHGHEAPTAKVTEKGGGTYAVEVVFSMSGTWRLRLNARTHVGDDGKTFQYDVP